MQAMRTLMEKYWVIKEKELRRNQNCVPWRLSVKDYEQCISQERLLEQLVEDIRNI